MQCANNYESNGHWHKWFIGGCESVLMEINLEQSMDHAARASLICSHKKLTKFTPWNITKLLLKFLANALQSFRMTDGGIVQTKICLTHSFAQHTLRLEGNGPEVESSTLLTSCSILEKCLKDELIAKCRCIEKIFISFYFASDKWLKKFDVEQVDTIFEQSLMLPPHIKRSVIAINYLMTNQHTHRSSPRFTLSLTYISF